MLKALLIAGALAWVTPVLADQVYVHVRDGVVIDRAVFGDGLPADWPDASNWIASENAQIGWSYAGGTLTAPPVAPPPAPTADEIRRGTLKSDPARADLLTRLQTATSPQIDAYIDANVTTLAQARTFLKALTKLLATSAAANQ